LPHKRDSAGIHGGGDVPGLTITHVGGEPMLNYPTIRAAVAPMVRPGNS
jgi:hypothetical protein